MTASMVPTDPLSWDFAFDEVADELLDDAEMQRPPVDVIALSSRLKIEITVDHALPVRGRHKRIGGRPSIFLRPDERPERMQWAAAHELGEVVAYRVLRRVGLPDDDLPPQLREEVANRMASRLLLPSRWFPDDAARTNGDLFELKQTYRTASHELIAFRLLDLPEQTIVSVFDQGKLTRRRGNGCARPVALQRFERACWSEAHVRNRACKTHEFGLTVQAWPIHEAGWKREILRTTAADDVVDRDDWD